MKKSEIKVGQKVKVVDGNYHNMIGMIGEVVKFSEDVLCKFPGWKGGHSGGVEYNSYEYWYFPFEDVTPVVEYTTKYKPGDVVTVRSDLKHGSYEMANGDNPMWTTDQMLTKRGQKVKIKSVTKTGKYMIEGSIFPWVDEMFVDESKVEPKKTKSVTYKVGDKVIIGSSNIGDGYKGQVGVIVEIDHTYRYPYAVTTNKYRNGESRLWCKVTGYAVEEPKCKFKVGDKVVAKKNAPYDITTNGWKGEVVDVGAWRDSLAIFVKGEGMIRCPVDPKYFDFLEEPKPQTWELVIRGEGDKTTAEYIVNDVKTTAKVHRYFEDQYSVRKAVEVVTNKVLPEEKWVVGVKFDSGSKVYDYYTTDNTIKPGDKVVVPTGKDNHHVAVTVVNIQPASEVLATVLPDNMKYVDRKCTEDDVITYYNGKVVCVYATPTSAYTVGKIYNIVDGQLRIYSGVYVPTTPAKTFKDFEEQTHGIANFVEIVE